MFVAAAAAARRSYRGGALAEADSVNARFPTYYGDAWAAIGRIQLATPQFLRSC